MRSTTPTIIAAMRILAADIQCDDGIANGAIHEAADRLEELSSYCGMARADEREGCVRALRIKAGQAMDAAMKAKAAGDDATAMDIRHATWMEAVNALNGGDE